VLLHKFWTYFFQIGEVEAPFLNLLSTAINNFIEQKRNFLANNSLGTVHMLPVFSRKEMILCRGQLISKGLFGILEFFQKTNKQIRF
jgi:hypothetical protein